MTGILAEVAQTHAIVDLDGIGYEVLVCGFAVGELTAQRGQQVTLHTMQYLEGTSAGGNMIPRLVGFLHPEDRAFFERFITVKGIGVKKALKALVIPTGKLAAAIEAGDAKALARLPGVGARAADQIIAELKGKVGDFAIGQTADGAPPAAAVTWTSAQRDALEVMIALGERRSDAERWLARAMQLSPDTATADEWVRLAYRIRSGM
ncbi:MAG: Holliday junction DNA helicase RuvA [Planctomycetes bacterium]|nr:Holliday junction DNA helicase RuvA [Planctomycetota bacterium]